jgi:hypothetical protein
LENRDKVKWEVRELILEERFCLDARKLHSVLEIAICKVFFYGLDMIPAVLLGVSGGNLSDKLLTGG